MRAIAWPAATLIFACGAACAPAPAPVSPLPPPAPDAAPAVTTASEADCRAVFAHLWRLERGTGAPPADLTESFVADCRAHAAAVDVACALAAADAAALADCGGILAP